MSLLAIETDDCLPTDLDTSLGLELIKNNHLIHMIYLIVIKLYYLDDQARCDGSSEIGFDYSYLS